MAIKKEKKLALVAVLGRTNVGKSTLFNRLVGRGQALVSEIAGTTRDSNFGLVRWAGANFELADTAGFTDWRRLIGRKVKTDDVDSQAQKQARAYLDMADLILFITDAKSGLLPEDREIAAAIKRKSEYRNKTILVANKVDSSRLMGEAAQFNRLGLGEPEAISAASGLRTGDLLDIVVGRLRQAGLDVDEKADKDSKQKIEEIRACIIGKPNVGKSSLLNALLGYDRVIVSPQAHTTREPQHTRLSYRDQDIVLIDTAGISKQGKKGKGLEKPGIIKSLQSLDKVDIALLVLDASEPLAHQDAKLVEEISDRQKSLVIVANKWDKVKGRNTKSASQAIYDKLPFATWAPIQFVSAKTGEKMEKILDLILEIAIARRLELSASQTEKFLKHVVKIHRPAKGKGLKAPRIYEFRQIKSNPPSFSLRIGPNDDLHFSYVRFMENRLRERHSFLGTPIRISVTKHRKSHTTYNG